MTTPLMTPDGFPRADLDVAQSTLLPQNQGWIVLMPLHSSNNPFADNIFEERL